MRELLIDAAERAIQYLEGLDGRRVAPDPAVVAHLAALDIPLPDHPNEAGETLALLDSYHAAMMAIAGPRCTPWGDRASPIWLNAPAAMPPVLRKACVPQDTPF